VKDRRRLVLVSVDDAGAIHRRTISELPPPERRCGRQWAVADTDGPAAPRTPSATPGATPSPTPSRGAGAAGSLVA
jgi:hypothetical protein